MKIKPSHYPFLPRHQFGRFSNVHLDDSIKIEDHEHLLGSLRMFFSALHVLFRKDCQESKKKWICQEGERVHDVQAVTWYGHATCLIKTEKVSILTDPVFESLSVLYKRKVPNLELAHLPAIDVVLVSHNHRDHLDKKTIQRLSVEHDPFFLVPQGDKKLLQAWGITKVEEFLWWEKIILNETAFTFVPAWHWSQRALFDRNKSLWGGWVMQDAQSTIYFAGDTAYNKKYFDAIARQFPCIDLALLPIGPGEPEDLMRRSHVNAEQAGQLFLDVGARAFLPIHWGTFQFGFDHFDTPIKRLIQWWNTVMSGRPGYELLLAPVGKAVHLERKNSCSDTRDQNHQKS